MRSTASAPKTRTIPLALKVMASYVVVAGVVFIPTFVYLQTALRQQMRAATRTELERDLGVLVDRLERAPPEKLLETVGKMVDTMPARFTVVDAEGRVLGDTIGRPLDNHAGRPEIRDALAAGLGIAERFSETTQENRLYVARRFPAVGPPRGVARLSIATRELDEAIQSLSSFVRIAGGLAITAAILLSLLASVLVSRPLTRLAEAARAFASGDFGRPVPVHSHDELGEAAQALRELATQLRGTLIESGADRATLKALLDELASGVIIYHHSGNPLVINTRARQLCGLSPNDESERAHQIAEIPDHAAIRHRVQQEQAVVSARLVLPWDPKRKLIARWLSVFGPDGLPRPALVIEDSEREARFERATEALARANAILRRTARALPPEENALRAEAERAADESLTEIPTPHPSPEKLESREIQEICTAAIEDLKGRLAARSIGIQLALPDDGVRVIEEQGRAIRAVRALIAAAAAELEGGSRMTLRGDVDARRVTLTVGSLASKPEMSAIADLVTCVGGSAGCERRGELFESWLALPRA